MLSLLPRCFVAIADHGSITGAADDLGLAKSAVSQNLKRLEQQLGVKLAIRTTRRLSLTPAGALYYQRCVAILSLAQQAATEMEGFGAAPAGVITLTAPHALIEPVIAPALARVLDTYPALQPRVLADDRRLDLTAEGIDLAITVGTLPDSSLRARRIGALHDILCAAPSVLAQAPDGADLTDWIATAPCIARTTAPAQLDHAGLRLRPSLRCTTIQAMAACARAGLGLALLPDLSIRDDLAAGRLLPVPTPQPPQAVPIHAVHGYDHLVPQSVQACIAATRAVLTRV